jgi:hypothetical protein
MTEDRCNEQSVSDNTLGMSERNLPACADLQFLVFNIDVIVERLGIAGTSLKKCPP